MMKLVISPGSQRWSEDLRENKQNFAAASVSLARSRHIYVRIGTGLGPGSGPGRSTAGTDWSWIFFLDRRWSACLAH